MRYIARHMLLPLALSALVCSCYRERIYDERSDYRIEIGTQFDMLYNRPAKAPALYRANFYDHLSHHLVSSATVSSKGGYLYNLQPGVYDVLVYDYTLNRTKIVDASQKDQIHAVTTPMAYREYPVVESPDHLFVASADSLVVPHISSSEDEWVLRVEPRSAVQSWKLVVDGIRGLRNADAIDIYVTGQSESLHFGRTEHRLNNRDVAIWFQGTPDYAKEQIVTTFNTFGKMFGFESKLILDIYIVGVGGDRYICHADVTDQFDDPDNVDHVITASFDVVVAERKDGGMAPVVNPWDPDIDDIEIE